MFRSGHRLQVHLCLIDSTTLNTLSIVAAIKTCAGPRWTEIFVCAVRMLSWGVCYRVGRHEAPGQLIPSTAASMSSPSCCTTPMSSSSLTMCAPPGTASLIDAIASTFPSQACHRHAVWMSPWLKTVICHAASLSSPSCCMLQLQHPDVVQLLDNVGSISQAARGSHDPSFTLGLAGSGGSLTDLSQMPHGAFMCLHGDCKLDISRGFDHPSPGMPSLCSVEVPRLKMLICYAASV